MNEVLNRAYTQLQNGLSDFIANAPAYAIGLIAFYIIYRVSTPLSNLVKSGLERAKRSESIQLVIARLTRGAIVFGGALVGMAIALPSFQVDDFISILGIGSVAIGFAFRDILQNFLAGILILLTEPFRIGDQIIFGSYEGTVEDIQIRATLLKTYDSRRVVIPNGELFTDSVMVNTAFKKRRSQYDIGIGYDDDIEAAQELCMQVLRETEGVLDSPAPDTIVTEMGDSAVVFRVRWWTNPRQADVMRVQNRALRDMKNRLTEEGFDIPYPIRTVFLNQDDSADT